MAILGRVVVFLYACIVLYQQNSLITIHPNSLASPVELCLSVGPCALSEKIGMVCTYPSIFVLPYVKYYSSKLPATPLFAFCIDICHTHFSVNVCLQIHSHHPHHNIILFITACLLT